MHSDCFIRDFYCFKLYNNVTNQHHAVKLNLSQKISAVKKGEPKKVQVTEQRKDVIYL